MTETMRTGWNEHGHARTSGTWADRLIGSGALQDAENCGYTPSDLLAEIGSDEGQHRAGRIVCADGTVLERGGTLNSVWAVVGIPGQAGPA